MIELGVGGGCERSTGRLTTLVVDVQGAPLVHAGDLVVVGAVEAVDPDHAGLGLHVGVVRVGGVQVVLKHGEAVQMLDLRERQMKRMSERRREIAKIADGGPRERERL